LEVDLPNKRGRLRALLKLLELLSMWKSQGAISVAGTRVKEFDVTSENK